MPGTVGQTLQRAIILSLLEKGRKPLSTQNEEVRGKRTALPQTTMWDDYLGQILVYLHSLGDRSNATHHQLNPMRIKA
jgi:hypothetical protein